MVVTGPKTLGHGTDHIRLRILRDPAVAAENPDQPGILVTLSQPLAILSSIVKREDQRFIAPLVAPGRQESYVHTQFIGSVHNPVHVLPVRLHRLQGVMANQWLVAVAVGRVDPVNLGKSH